ncbi:hypothetical protein PHMEG_00016891 [Phytophthora megakarya]|uniref:Transmembrane protein n=1 Tax=Phytophthora megakarya TaxID=4795 RepID=A0A225VXX7_9STRA|nr:hypothetical protein PHMEG_00016891 [Phytophthora megakarya]
MAQVAPLTTSDVTVVVFTAKDEASDKLEIVEQPTSTMHKILLGLLYTLMSSGCIYGCIATITFFGDVFTLLLVATRA